MLEWIAGLRQVDNCIGITIRRSDDTRSRDALVALWPRDANAAEVADALARLADDLRKQSH